MRITERQLHQLITLLNTVAWVEGACLNDSNREIVVKLLNEINNQQSTELKDITDEA